jgi:two-component system phosphate regulon response regulator PhoB
MAHVLVIEDERDVADVIEYNLRAAGYATTVASTAADGLSKLREVKPDLVLLDLMLPDRSGTEVCRLAKSNRDTAHVPIIIVTARTEEIDRVVGFELGADDYVTKPFSMRELLLRVKRTLNRRESGHFESAADERRPLLAIDTDAHRVKVAEESVSLSALEFRLLRTLAEQRGRVLTREALLASVWGQDTTVSLRTVDAHVKRLRSRLGRGGGCIETVRGVGYRYSALTLDSMKDDDALLAEDLAGSQ